MKVIHIESGLGNQMLSYCELLALRKVNPTDDFYLETIVYDIPECNDTICQWNGFELKRVFNICEPNIAQIFKEEEWENIIQEIRLTKFWDHNWNWPVYFEQVFQAHGLNIHNAIGDFEAKGCNKKTASTKGPSFKDSIRNLTIYQYLHSKKIHQQYLRIAPTYSNEAIHFLKSEENLLAGQRLTFKNIGSGIEQIEKDIRKAFIFTENYEERNASALKEIHSCNAVAIHARRGDMLGSNYDCYKFGYFQRCMKYIKSQVPNPVFYIFCDPDSVSWAKNNAPILGLDIKRDAIRFVDWNKGLDSYRDMQLMAACKHQVITRSSFGWWGAWLNEYPGKITCSPDPLINTTHHF